MLKKWLPGLFTALFVLFGLGLLALALMSYGSLKTLTGSLMPDGEFETLNPANWIVFRGIFVAGFLAACGLALLFVFRLWGRVGAFLKQWWADAGRFFASLRLQKDGLGFLVAVLVLQVLAVVYRLEYLYSSLHHDEAYTFMAFSHSLKLAVSDYHLPNNHVFHSILVYFSTRIFGNEPWAVRLPAFMAGILLVPAVYVLGKRVYDRWTGLAAALLVAVAPVLVGYSTNARGYSLVALFTLLILSLGDYVRKEKNLFAWGLISLFSALGFYTVPVMLYPFGTLFVWLFLENQVAGPGPYRSKWEFLRYWLFSGLLSAALTLILYLPILAYSGPAKLLGNEFVTPAAWEDAIKIFSYHMGQTWQEWTVRTPMIVIGIILVGLVLGTVLHKRLSMHRVPLQVAALVWLILIVLVQRPKTGGKIWLFLMPLVLLWAAAGLAGLLARVRVKFMRGLPLAAVGIGLVFLAVCPRAITIVSELSELWALRGDEENSVVYVQEQLTAGDEVVVAPPDDAAVWYYAELHGVDDMLYRTDEEFDRLFVLVNPAEGQTVETVISARGPGLDMVEILDAQLVQTIGKLQVYVVPIK